MGQVRNGAPTQWDCVVFTMVATHKTKKKAQERLSRDYQEDITVKGIENILKKIDTWLGETTFKEPQKGILELTVRGKRFLRFAKRIVTSFQEERAPSSERMLPKIVCLPHHGYVTSQLECELRERHPSHEDQIIVEELGLDARGDDGFEDEALYPLTLGHHEIAIGGKTTVYQEELQSDVLYSTQLEVMVPATYQTDRMSLTELVNEYRAMVPPEGSRSRKLLETWITRARISAPPKELRIVAETYESTMNIQRTSDDHQRFGIKSKRVVVAPSDVALLYKAGSRFGGSGVESSRWVPLHHDGKTLKLDVYVTTTKPRPKHIDPIVQMLREICEKRPHLSGTFPLPPAPTARTRPKKP
ncbi:hypothetical protein ACWDV4_16565 [Micromonospora sp. NPDC003197]